MDALIFDLDGTLINSMWVWKKADNEVLKKYGHEIDDEYLEHVSKFNNRQCLEYIIERYKIPATVEELGRQINGAAFRHYCEDVKLKNGVYEYIKAMKEKGVKMAVTTSCLRAMCEAVLKKHGIFDDFDVFVYSDELGKNKSYPDIYIETANRLNVMPNSCVVFEDLPAAAESAKRAGMKVVGVYDEFSGNKETMMRVICHDYIKDFCQYYTKNGL